MDQHVPLLEVRGLCKSFGALVVADGVSLALRPGARHALIGPNGAGKTTLVNLITGTVAPSVGVVLLDGHDVTHWSQARRVKHGLARTFQINTLFRGLSVLGKYLHGGQRAGVLSRPGCGGARMPAVTSSPRAWRCSSP